MVIWQLCNSSKLMVGLVLVIYWHLWLKSAASLEPTLLFFFFQKSSFYPLRLWKWVLYIKCCKVNKKSLTLMQSVNCRKSFSCNRAPFRFLIIFPWQLKWTCKHWIKYVWSILMGVELKWNIMNYQNPHTLLYIFLPMFHYRMVLASLYPLTMKSNSYTSSTMLCTINMCVPKSYYA